MKKKNDETKEVIQRIHDYALEEIMGERFGRYCKTIILDRALPDVRDGLKPVQRRILYGMYKSGNTYDKKYRKSAKAVGEIMGNYHPHGDSSIYDAMVRMSQDWKMMVPYIDMHGNNGW
jgi:topoisomerase-4 subunit A